MKILDTSDVDGIHDAILLQSGGLPGKSMERPIDSVLHRVFNHVLYGNKSDISHVAALYAYSIAVGHPYMDGNKRTAMTVMLVFLQLNKKRFNASDFELVDKMISIADKKMNLDEFSKWVKHHVQ